jgi:hypothetical protein
MSYIKDTTLSAKFFIQRQLHGGGADSATPRVAFRVATNWDI